MLDFIKERVAYLQGKSYNQLKNVFIETHSACTNNCYMCPRSTRHTFYRPITDKKFIEIIARLQKINFSGNLHLYGQNEPFLDQKIIERIYYCHDKLPQAKIIIISNFTFLNDKLIDEILAAPIHNFSCSTYALDQETYKKICRRDNFKKSFINQVKFLKKYAVSHPFSFANYIIENEYNKHDIQFIDYFLLNIVPAEYIQHGKSIALFSNASASLPLSNSYYSPCIHRDLKITANGEISSCPCDPNNLLSIGNIDDIQTTISDYYNNDKARQLRKKMRSSELSKNNYCQYCDFARSITIKDYLLGKIPKSDIYNHKNKMLRNSHEEILVKLEKYNQIFKDGDEENWIDCLNELRRKFYAKEL